MVVVGETGSGKTYLLSRLLKPHRYRDFVIILKTKLRDDTFDYGFDGYRTIRSVNDITVSRDYYVLAPERDQRRNEALRLLNLADRVGGWTIVIDELFYLQEKLGLTGYIDDLLTQGRSSGLTVICGMQRPVRITRFALSQARHVFAFDQEGRDAQELGYATSRAMRDAVEGLEEHQFAYFNRRQKRHIRVGRAQSLSRIFEEG